MARSLDKAAWSGHAPLCALCLTPRAERRSQVHLTHGIAVWLCPAHGSSAFLRRRAGRDFVHTLGDAHLYRNHLERARLQLTREPRPLPTMTLNPEVRSIFDFRFEDFTLSGYDPHPAIKAPIAV